MNILRFKSPLSIPTKNESTHSVRIAKPYLLSIVRVLCFLIFASVYLGVFIKSLNRAWYLPFISLLFLFPYYFVSHHNMEKTVFLCAFCIMVTTQLFLGYMLAVDYSTWDVYTVTKSARALVEGGNFNNEYFARYPNNIAILLLFTNIFKVTSTLFNSTSNYWLTLLNIVAIDIAVLLMVKTINCIAGSPSGYRAGLLATVFAPLYLYVPITYTDTFSMPLLGIIAYLIVKLCMNHDTWKTAQQTLCCIGIGLFLVLGYRTKGSLAIMMIACFICLFFRLNTKLFVQKLSCILLTVIISNIFVTTAINNTQIVTDDEYQTYRFPVTHWIMMGLSGSGNYHSDDVKYTSSFDGYNEKCEAIANRLTERINSMGILGVIRQFYHKAVDYGWNYGTCFAERYIGDSGDMPIRRNILHQFVLTHGSYHNFLYAITQGIWLLLFGFSTIGMLLSDKKSLARSTALLLLQVSITGCMLFFMLWETHPRYILHFTLILIMLASQAMDDLKEKLIRFNNFTFTSTRLNRKSSINHTSE